MDPERWGRISQLFHTAAPLDPSERSAFLEKAAPDFEVRKEVEELLQHCGSTAPFLARFPSSFVPHLGEGTPMLASGALVSGRFRILKFLGAGGMGEVYEAEDLTLRGRVALKTLPALMSGDPDAVERLKREIALARRVTHPNVCRVFDVDQHEGPGGVITFFTMELLQGETLEERLRQRGTLTTSAAYPLVKQIAAALSAAHAAGVVHGDLKPGNVMIVTSEGQTDRAVVTDFGLALRASTDSTTTILTAVNRGWGTPDYMAPEQIEHHKATFASDVYALGTLTYRMIAGTLPYEGTSSFDLALKKVRYPPRPLRDHVADIDGRWRSAIDRCLEREPKARLQTPDEFVRALDHKISPSAKKWRWVAGLAAVVTLMVGLALSVIAPERPATETLAVSERGVVLLPFNDQNPTADNLVLARGFSTVVTDQIRHGLKLQNLDNRVWFAPAAEAIDAELTTPLDARQTLGVDQVVTGRIVRDSGQTLLTLGLSDMTRPGAGVENQLSVLLPGGQIWLPTAVGRLAEQLGARLAPATLQALAVGGTVDAGAEESYLRGRGHLAGPLTSLDLAIEAFQHANQLDRDYAFAHAALSEAYRLKYVATRDPVFVKLATASNDRALALQPKLAYTRIVRGFVYRTTGQDERAIREFQLALEAEPDAENALRGLAEAYEAQGDIKSAERMYQEEIKLYPHYWSAYEQYGSFLFRHARYKEAETSFLSGVHYAPANPRAINNLAAVYIFTERFEAADMELQRGLTLGRPDVLIYNNLSWARIFQGHLAEAVDPMERAVKLPGANSFHWGNLARVYRWADRRDQAKATYATALGKAREEIRVNPYNPQIRANLAQLLAETRSPEEALQEMDSTLEQAPNDTTVIFKSALVYELVGNRAAALKALETAARAGHSIVEIRRHPDLANLRQDPRYSEMMAIVVRRNLQ